MVFEIYKKGHWRQRLEDNQISIAKTSISFGRDTIVDFLKKGFVEVYLDKDENRIGFKSTKSNITGFKVLYEEGKDITPRITSKVICSLIPIGRYEMQREGDMFVINVLEIARK